MDSKKHDERRRKKDSFVGQNQYQLYEIDKKNPDPNMKYEDWIKFLINTLDL